MEAFPSSPRRTANGRLRACAPCRRQKLACDHSHPCSRCKRLGQERRCSYPVPAATPARTERPFSKSVQGITAPSSMHGLVSCNTGQLSPQSTICSPGTDAPVGYLGFTSFKTVYQETEDTLSYLGASSKSPRGSQDSGSAHISAVLSPVIRELCIQVLRKVPTPRDGIRLFHAANTCDGWIHRCAGMILQGLYGSWGGYLTADRDDEKLEEMALSICINTTNDVEQTSSDPEAWVGQFSGQNLRWDALGLLFNYWKLGGDESRDFTPEARRPLFMCIRICRDLVDTPTIWLRYLHFRRVVTETKYSGDASRWSWRYHAESVSLATFHGSHASHKDVDYRPSFASECERRLLWATFGLDKNLVSITGRPPLLSRRYVSTPLPLDLKDDYLFVNEDELRYITRNKLDKSGWNTEGGVYYSTLLRARSKLAVMADEIFEMVLDDNLAFEPGTIGKILTLREKATLVYDQLPSGIIWQTDDMEKCRASPDVLVYRLLTRLDHLKNLFIIDRLLLKYGHRLDGDLLGVSFELASLAVAAWTHRERYVNENADFAWFLMAYGVPAGGVLCLELLRPMSAVLRATDVHITRSHIVQILSLLIGFLDWLKPSAPNGSICKKSKESIQQVLDYTLNTSSTSHTQAATGTVDTSLPTNFDFDFDLMDTLEDWFRYDPALNL